MIDRSNRLLTIIAGSFFLIVLAISVFLFIRNDSQWHRYVLFFPKYTNPEVIQGEIRKIRRYENMEKNIDRLVHECMLGPEDLRNIRIMPGDGKINTVLLRDNAVYIDFSHSILFSEEVSPLTLTERLTILSQSIRWNFPDIKTINYSINGEVPIDIMANLAENRVMEKKK